MTVRNTYLHAATKLSCQSSGLVIQSVRQQIACRLVMHSKTKVRLDEFDYLKWESNECDSCHACLHLNFWWGQRFPVVGFELVEFIKLQADVLDRQLEHVPETCQVLGDGPRVCIWVLRHKKDTLFLCLSHTFGKMLLLSDD